MQATSQYLQVLSSVDFPKEVEFVSWNGNKLTLRMKQDMPTAERGHMLLELEKRLHREIDPDVQVFLQPRGDMEKLRVKLRGAKV